jgi:hypothetical protein
MRAPCQRCGLRAPTCNVVRLGGRSAHTALHQQAATPASQRRRQPRVLRLACAAAERKEYYSYKDMPPVPLTVSRITIPALDYVVVDRESQERRMASLAIFFDIYKDDQYRKRLTRKSAITALCM